MGFVSLDGLGQGFGIGGRGRGTYSHCVCCMLIELWIVGGMIGLVDFW